MSTYKPCKYKTTRRKFLRTSCLAAAAGASVFLPTGQACSGSTPPEKIKQKSSSKITTAPQKIESAFRGVVAEGADPKVFVKGEHNHSRVNELVQRTVSNLVNVNDPAEAFRAIFHPNDIVAIKVNCLAGPGLSSSPAVVDALVAGLKSIGIAYKNIYIWERSTAEMVRAGFKSNRYSDNRPKCFGNDEGGFERELSFSGDVGSLWSKVLANKATALINVPVLKDHDLAGVGCGMKNMYGAIHNPNRYHDNNCNPFVADVNAHPYVKDKLRLVLADALTAQYHGGPAQVKSHQWKPAKILAAQDPVALDTIAQHLLEQARATHGMKSFTESKRSPKWLQTAADKDLGENKLNKIERVIS